MRLTAGCFGRLLATSMLTHRNLRFCLFQSKRHRFENESVSYRQHSPFHPNLLLSIRKIHTRGYKTFLYVYIITQPIYAPQYPFGYFKATFLEIFEYFWNKKKQAAISQDCRLGGLSGKTQKFFLCHVVNAKRSNLLARVV